LSVSTQNAPDDGEYQSLPSLVLDRLREAILEGRYKPGERIRQEAVAREMGTSRIPVRDALSRLQKEGLVTITAHVGARVATLDMAELDEVYLIRERIEPLAIKRSAPRLTDEHLEELAGYVEEMEKCASVEDPSRWVELDRRFHLTTYAGAQLPRMHEMIVGLWNASQQYRRVYTALPSSFSLAHIEHRLMLEALRQRDAELAELVSLKHIRRTRLALANHAELFDEEGSARSS
jgi:DNA-binding GntR family transcriptional regulator